MENKKISETVLSVENILNNLGFETPKIRETLNIQTARAQIHKELTLKQKAVLVLLKNSKIGFTNRVRALFASKSPYKIVKKFESSFNTGATQEKTKAIINYIKENSETLQNLEMKKCGLRIKIALKKEEKKENRSPNYEMELQQLKGKLEELKN